jgi:phosphatidylglycerol:prolipoprotein diacylglycerol transferase
LLPLLIPYWQAKVLYLWKIPIDPWATLICIGFIFGLEVGRARGIKLGLRTQDVVDGGVFTVSMGFVVGHLVHVLAYNPHLMAEDPWILLKVWAGFSSNGGFLGAILGIVLFYKKIRPRPFWIHADVVMFGFPFGWVWARLGCFAVKDHIGARSDFFLAIDFPAATYGGPRHAVALYEALAAAGICLIFLWLGRSRRKIRPGTFAALWCLLYAPTRFCLDFLRNTDLPNADVRWHGLTPAQYGSLVMFAAGLALLLWLRTRPDEEGVATASEAG